MNGWSFLSSVAWPIVVLLALFALGRPIARLLRAIAIRAERNAPIKITKDGVEVGPTPKLEEANPKAQAQIGELPHLVYMSHGAVRAADLDREGQEYFRIRIFLDADEPQYLKQVERVIYHLHPTFVNPKRESTDAASQFEIRTAGWGDFNMWAEVHFKPDTQKSQLDIERYITLRVPVV